MLSPVRSPIIFHTVLGFVCLGWSVLALAQQGIPSRAPMGAYLNGSLPTNLAETAYRVEEAFPALRFKDPIRLVSPPGRPDRLWVLAQDGEIWDFSKTTPTSKSLLLDLRDRCVGHNEGEGDSGLLGIAFHPQFGQVGSSKRGYIYLWYSFRPPGEWNPYFTYNRLSRFNIADGATTIDPATELVLINQYDRKTWHNGGGMFFGPDGFLYITNGDEGDDVHGETGGGVYTNSQKINDGLFSGVLRIDVDMNPTTSHAIRRQPRSSATPPAGWPSSYSQNYFIPNDNPWQSSSGAYLEEFYAIGLRSPHSLTYDTVTGKALIGETGQDEQEEINVMAKGVNYQWPFLEGSVPGPWPSLIGPGTSTPPIHVNPNRTVDGSGMVGGWVYRGSQFAADLGGKYVFADFISNKIWALDWQTPGAPRRWLATVPRVPGETAGVTGISVDADKELYITMHGDQGRIYKLVSTGATSAPPATLSATGAFSNIANLTPASGIVPFAVNSQLWSDGAEKWRWIALPNNGAPYTSTETVGFTDTGEWSFPVGTVTIKHFELPTNENNPAVRKRLETRFIVRTQQGWYGLTYRWRADGTDADLVPTGGSSADITITQANGSTRVQRWDFPSRENCMGCHNAGAGFALGLNTRQLNGVMTYPSTGISAHQLSTWSAIGMLDTTLSAGQIAGLAKTSAVTDTSVSLTQRMRSYLDANCSHCHRPGGVLRSSWDARFDTPLALQGIVDVVPEGTFGIDGARVIKPGDKDKSLMYIRMNDTWNVQAQMPPLARNVLHDAAMDTLTQWITQLASGGNQSPVLTSPGNQSTVRGATVSLQIIATDVDGPSLSYSASGLPDGLTISATTGLITGTVSTSAAASNTVVVGVSDGTASDSETFTWTATAAPLPVGALTSQDIGSVFAPGTTTFDAGGSIFTMQAYGSQIHGAADDFRMAHQVLNGDGEIVARIRSHTSVNEWSDAGLMIRETLAANSRQACIGTTPSHGFAAKHRTTTGGTTTYVGGPSMNAAPNNWVRIVRAGNLVSLHTSSNGTSWTQLTSVTFSNLAPSVYVGLVLCSVEWNQQATASYDSLRTQGLVLHTPYFLWANTAGLTGNNLALTAAPGRDGIANLLKYAFNLNPAQPDIRWLEPNTGLAGLPSAPSVSGGTFRFEYLRRKGSSLTYTPKKSTQLTTWLPFTSVPTLTSIDANWERVIHQEPLSSAGQVFSTVEVTLP